jgi:endonuclease/exonuclease/phosphatase (EEP) superfamily protein YafD
MPLPANFLSDLSGKKRRLKKTKTKVRTRDGRIFEETRSVDGQIQVEFKGTEVLPSFLADSATKSLPIYRFLENKWTRVPKQTLTDSKDSQNIPTQEQQNPAQQILTVVSFNVWFADERWQERQDELVNLLQSRTPDLICLQEVTPRFMVTPRTLHILARAARDTCLFLR